MWVFKKLQCQGYKTVSKDCYQSYKETKRGISSIKAVAAVQNSLWWITNIFKMKIWKNTEMKLT